MPSESQPLRWQKVESPSTHRGRIKLAKFRFQTKSLLRLLWLVSWLTIASLSQATSIVILRSPFGGRIVVAADSQFSVDAAIPMSACKIVQLEGEYWTVISGLASEPGTHFDSYQIAQDASFHHKDNLDDIASEVNEKTLTSLPLALEKRRKAIGEEAFRREYGEGLDAHEEAFWGVESGTLRLIYLQFTLHVERSGTLTITSAVQKCPGSACPDPDSGFAVMMGHHKVIDRFMTQNSGWQRLMSLEARAQEFVQMEITNEPDCHCSPPIVVLRMDKYGNTNWIGPRGPACRAPR